MFTKIAVHIHLRVFTSLSGELHVGIASLFLHSLLHFRGLKVIGWLASQLPLISQVYSIAFFVQVKKKLSVSSLDSRFLIAFRVYY